MLIVITGLLALPLRLKYETDSLLHDSGCGKVRYRNEWFKPNACEFGKQRSASGREHTPIFLYKVRPFSTFAPSDAARAHDARFVFTRFWTTATLLAHCRGAVHRIRSSSSFDIGICSVKRHASCHHRRRLPLYAAELRLRGVTPHDCVESGFCSGEYSTQRLGADSGCLARFPLPYSS